MQRILSVSDRKADSRMRCTIEHHPGPERGPREPGAHQSNGADKRQNQQPSIRMRRPAAGRNIAGEFVVHARNLNTPGENAGKAM
jgi:hypothetical protein